MVNGARQRKHVKVNDDVSAVEIQQSNAQSLTEDPDAREASQESLAAAETMDNRYLKAPGQAVTASTLRSTELREAAPGDQHRDRDQERRNTSDDSDLASERANTKE